MHKNLNWLKGQSPHIALAELRRTGDLALLLPEVDALYGVPQNADHHPEVDTGVHTEMCLEMAEKLGADINVRFAVLVHDLGKGLTPPEEWPRHISHEVRGLAPVAAVCDRFGITGYPRDLALLVCEHHLLAHTLFLMRSKKVVEYFDRWQFLEPTPFMDDFVLACEADKRGRLHRRDKEYPQKVAFTRIRDALRSVPKPANTSLTVREGAAYHKARIAAVQAIMAEYRPAKKLATS